MSNELNKLHIDIGSFSYRKGYPVNATEHGGGFVFDCRFIKNPGREDRYKKQTGKQAEVISYLEDLPETDEYFKSISTIVLAATKAYQARGFTYISVQFGCTGGQHRSVYFAERLTKFLKSLANVQVNLTHRDCPEF